MGKLSVRGYVVKDLKKCSNSSYLLSVIETFGKVKQPHNCFVEEDVAKEMISQGIGTGSVVDVTGYQLLTVYPYKGRPTVSSTVNVLSFTLIKSKKTVENPVMNQNSKVDNEVDTDITEIELNDINLPY